MKNNLDFLGMYRQNVLTFTIFFLNKCNRYAFYAVKNS